jgi:hypothetical protein
MPTPTLDDTTTPTTTLTEATTTPVPTEPTTLGLPPTPFINTAIVVTTAAPPASSTLIPTVSAAVGITAAVLCVGGFLFVWCRGIVRERKEAAGARPAMTSARSSGATELKFSDFGGSELAGGSLDSAGSVSSWQPPPPSATASTLQRPSQYGKAPESLNGMTVLGVAPEEDPFL